MMKTVPDDGLILDHGGGDRTMSDPRYVNAEYTHYELPHVYADALYLPFKDNTFDFVMSQAVLEHVPDPFRAVEEIRRVTKVGGKVWAGFAFMQPVHAVPYHYFNSTAWGAEHLFQNMTIERLSWSGDLSFTIDWMCKAVGLGDKVEAERYRAVMDEIKSWDKLITYEELRDVASGVAVIARKR
ncbi:MAG: class I SAM-dependent methyltransferase [Bryobacterales bacterium]|nr:class I SAM-dependent methyltransferase [Bryobacterales bacterium]